MAGVQTETNRMWRFIGRVLGGQTSFAEGVFLTTLRFHDPYVALCVQKRPVRAYGLLA